MNENRPCKKELLEWINIVSFAVDDVKLFLDTHPNCTEALDFLMNLKATRAGLKRICQILRSSHA